MVEFLIKLFLKLFGDNSFVELNAMTIVEDSSKESSTFIVSKYMDFVVILDPGHGILELGKRSPDGKLREYIKVREIATAIIRRLHKHKIPFKVTTPDYDYQTNTFNLEYPLSVSYLNKRAENAKNIQQRNRLFVSLHIDGIGDDWNSANGITVFRQHGASQRVSLIYLKHLSNPPLLRIRKNPAKEENFAVLRHTHKHMHSILVEHGFMTNKEDVEWLNNPNNIEKIADAHLKAIKEIATTYEQLGKY
jgi:N-acetylmuramoyl-L-alanine amidase